MPIKQITGIPGVPGAVGIWDDDPAAIDAHAALTSGPHDLGATWFSKYIIRGKARSGIPTGQACWFAEDFTDIARWQQVVPVPPPSFATAVTTMTGGVAEIAAGVGVTISYQNGDATLGAPSLFAGNGRFYVACRIKIVTVPADGQVVIGGLNAGAGEFVYCGYWAMIDATHFSGVALGAALPATLVSTVLLDANWHDIELWYNVGSTSYYLSVDGETAVAGVTADPPASLMPVQVFSVGGAGAGTTAQFDKLLCVFPQAA